MGLLTIIKKVKQKEKEMRFLMVYAPRSCVHLSMCFGQRRFFAHAVLPVAAKGAAPAGAWTTLARPPS
jgi:asparagine N-glycosylation enzyme membrane subunit Stt3